MKVGVGMSADFAGWIVNGIFLKIALGIPAFPKIVEER